MKVTQQVQVTKGSIKEALNPYFHQENLQASRIFKICLQPLTFVTTATFSLWLKATSLNFPLGSKLCRCHINAHMSIWTLRPSKNTYVLPCKADAHTVDGKEWSHDHPHPKYHNKKGMDALSQNEVCMQELRWQGSKGSCKAV